MNKRGELTDMKREREASWRGGRPGGQNNLSFLVIRDKAERKRKAAAYRRGSRQAFN